MAAGKSVYERFGTSTLIGSVQTGLRWVVTGGDTLPAIAAAVYPDEGYSSEAWRQIAEENDITDLDDDLTVGSVLVIPSLKPRE